MSMRRYVSSQATIAAGASRQLRGLQQQSRPLMGQRGAGTGGTDEYGDISIEPLTPLFGTPIVSPRVPGRIAEDAADPIEDDLRRRLLGGEPSSPVASPPPSSDVKEALLQRDASTESGAVVAEGSEPMPSRVQETQRAQGRRIALFRSNWDYLLRRRTTFLTLNAMLGIVLLIAMLQQCWDGEHCHSNSAVVGLKFACSASTLVLLWQLLDRKRLEMVIKARDQVLHAPTAKGGHPAVRKANKSSMSLSLTQAAASSSIPVGSEAVEVLAIDRPVDTSNGVMNGGMITSPEASPPAPINSRSIPLQSTTSSHAPAPSRSIFTSTKPGTISLAAPTTTIHVQGSNTPGFMSPSSTTGYYGPASAAGIGAESGADTPVMLNLKLPAAPSRAYSTSMQTRPVPSQFTRPILDDLGVLSIISVLRVRIDKDGVHMRWGIWMQVCSLHV